ncbi:MAG: phosphoglycerate dehydrogenase [Candidatus Sumerlaeota bacterium]|nr:phosphoglycerate dehydrogenase [Candidatus Sumerlaeota bacterium]
MIQAADKLKIMVSDSLTDEGLRILQAGGEFEVTYKPDITPDQLAAEIGPYSALVVRSRTNVAKAILAKAAGMKVIGRAGVGVDNIDVEAATARGIIVMNTPDGNTLSTAEHTMSMMLSMARRIAYSDRTMKAGRWEKKSITGVELFGKTLGVCGLGRIGREVAKRAQSFGMSVAGFDPYISKETAQKLSIDLKSSADAVVEVADVVTVHSPLNKETRGMIGAAQFAKAKPGLMVVNCARGGIVDESALLDALKSGKVAAAALDVFEAEPLPADHPFRSMDNVTLTPHLGAATTEAQENVARDVALQIVDALRGTVVRNAVNAPSIDGETLKRVRPYLNLAGQMGRFLAQIVKGRVKRLEVAYSGAIRNEPRDSITTAALKGFLEPHASQPINYVNARVRAEEKGLEILESSTSEPGDYTSLLVLRAFPETGAPTEIAGTLFGHGKLRIVRVNDIETEVAPRGWILAIENKDRPGVIGAVAVKLGQRDINIAEMALGRNERGGNAKTFIEIDGEIAEDAIAEIRRMPNIVSVDLVVC